MEMSYTLDGTKLGVYFHTTPDDPKEYDVIKSFWLRMQQGGDVRLRIEQSDELDGQLAVVLSVDTKDVGE